MMDPAASAATIVVIDSTALVADRHVAGPHWKALLRESTVGTIELVVPEVVVEEVVSHHRRELKESLLDIDRRVQKFARLAGVKWTVPQPDIDAVVLQLDLALRSTLDAARAVIEPYERLDVKLADVARRLHSRRKPFKDNGKGLGDAVVWAHVHRRATPRVAFVTNNSQDFCGPEGQLHPDLSDELPAGARVDIYATVKDYIDALFGDDDRGLRERATASMMAILAEPGNIEAIKDNVGYALFDTLFQSADGTIAAHVTEVEIHSVGLMAIHAHQTMGIPDDWVVVDLAVDCSLSLDVEPLDGDQWSMAQTRLQRHPTLVGYAHLDLDAGEFGTGELDAISFDPRSLDLAGFLR
jgi:predicted nucleic acid-binding protein